MRKKYLLNIKKIGLILLVLTLTFSCKEKKNDQNIEMIKFYHEALNLSDVSKIRPLINDSVILKELDYSHTFSKEEYLNLVQWDSVFKPTYKIIDIKKENDSVFKLKTSKTCTRILFLNEEPMINNKTIILQNGKIAITNITEYVVFNNEKWSSNRTKLLDWTKINHPEIKDFIHDQTKEGAIRFLKAIDLYTSEHK